MGNKLGKDFNFISLIGFTLPTMIMMIFMSLYTMVDGMFVSQFINTTALSALNIVFPMMSVLLAVGIMLSTGSSAVIAKELGEGKIKDARKHFSFITLVGVLFGVVFTTVGLIFIEPLVWVMGANEATFSYGCDYLRVLLLFMPMGMLQMLFQTLFVTAGKPYLGLTSTVLGGITNIVLDYVFIVPLQMGVTGAAVATGLGYCVPAVTGLVYFTFFRKGTLFFVLPKFDGKMLIKSCANGSSEMVTNLSMAVTTFMFNILMMKYAGEDGVAAITIVLYAQYLLIALFLGYSTGSAPVFSFNYGCENIKMLKRIFKISIKFVVVASVATFVLSLVLADELVLVFAKPNTNVYDLSIEGFYLFSSSFLFAGINIFSSAMFTAFSDGRVSAIISFSRTFLFIVVALLVLPLIMGITGIWIAIPVAEFLGIIVSVFYFIKCRKKYSYV